MNHERLESVINEYIEHFDELNHYFSKKEIDESYKWQAVTCFKSYWNIESSNFPEMFHKAMQPACTFAHNSAVQPITGIEELLRHDEEIEFVRSCFKELFTDDSGDLRRRQERAELFAQKINTHLEKHISGSHRFPQKLNNVIYYLSLQFPEDNYIFKATEAEKWANYIEYGDDFGSGTTFSLEKYYKMCDELLAELPKYNELLRLNKIRFDKTAKGFDDQLHILVYDIIFCASAHNLYDKNTFPRISIKERIKAAQLRQKKEELTTQIAEVKRQLQELQDSPITLPDLTGRQVKHKIFGTGTVTSCIGNSLVVFFPNQEKKLQYLTVVENGYLSSKDSDILEAFRLVTERVEKISSLKIALKNLEIELSQL